MAQSGRFRLGYGGWAFADRTSKTAMEMIAEGAVFDDHFITPCRRRSHMWRTLRVRSAIPSLPSRHALPAKCAGVPINLGVKPERSRPIHRLQSQLISTACFSTVKPTICSYWKVILCLRIWCIFTWHEIKWCNWGPIMGKPKFKSYCTKKQVVANNTT